MDTTKAAFKPIGRNEQNLHDAVMGAKGGVRAGWKMIQVRDIDVAAVLDKLQHARELLNAKTELEDQLEAIGAGGVTSGQKMIRGGGRDD